MNRNDQIQKENNGPRIVVLGGGYAGMISALRLARHAQAEIHLVNGQERFVERIRLHEAASGRNLRSISIPHLLRGRNVTFHKALATQINWRARTVTLSNGSSLAYDRLIYALGSQIDRTTPGAQENALALDGLDRAEQIPARLAALPPQSEVVVVGSGLTGTELVFELAERYPHLRWTVVGRSAYERGYTPAARDYFLSSLAARNITLRTGIDVQAVERDHLVTNAGDLPFALCLWAGSFRGVPVGRESGLAVNELDQVLVDETLRSITAPEIYVAGDSAALPASYQPHLVMGCKTAMPQGLHAAQNILAELRGDAPEPLRFQYTLTCVSLGRRDGLVQMLNGQGEPTAMFLRGRAAAWVKELICLSTVWALQLERHFDFYDRVVPRREQASPRSAQGTAQGQTA